MIKIKDKETALKLFENSAINHGDCSQNGDYKSVNKSYKEIMNSFYFLKQENLLDEILPMLENSNKSVQSWSATVLLGFDEKKAIQKLQEIVKESNFYSYSAELTIQEWKKGNLTIYK